MKIEIGQALHTGIVRKDHPNQDAIMIWNPLFHMRKGLVLALADGMGGYEGGAIASQIVTRSVVKTFRSLSNHTNPLQILDQCFSRAHLEVRRRARGNPKLASMGSTIVSLIHNPPYAYVGNIGDSRAYLVRDNFMQQMSKDHTARNASNLTDQITGGKADSQIQRSILSQSISANRTEISPFLARVETRPNDIWILCSDGLWSMVDETILLAVVCNLPPKIAAKRLVEIANSMGGIDNISVIIMRWGDGFTGIKNGDSINKITDRTDPGEPED